MRFADRMGHLKTAASFEMLARGKALEAQGRSIVHLGIGEPDFDTPSFIRRAAAEALEAGYTHYGPAPGLPEFRRTIAAQWRERRGIACEAANVVVTPGAKPILFFAMVALLEPGDEVLIPSPAFPNYNSIAEFLGARVVPVPLLPAKGFDVDLAALEARIPNLLLQPIVENAILHGVAPKPGPGRVEVRGRDVAKRLQAARRELRPEDASVFGAPLAANPAVDRHAVDAPGEAALRDQHGIREFAHAQALSVGARQLGEHVEVRETHARCVHQLRRERARESAVGDE